MTIDSTNSNAIDHSFIGMGLAERATLAKTTDGLAQLKERLKKQSREDRRELDQFLDKLIAAEGSFQAWLPLGEAHSYQLLEVKLLKSTDKDAPDQSNKDRLDSENKTLTKKEYQQQRDFFACCRKLYRMFARFIGWDVSKNTIIAKLTKLQELRCTSGIICNDRTIEIASQKALALWEKLKKEDNDHTDCEKTLKELVEKFNELIRVLPNQAELTNNQVINNKWQGVSNKQTAARNALENCKNYQTNSSLDQDLKDKLSALITVTSTALDSIKEESFGKTEDLKNAIEGFKKSRWNNLIYEIQDHLKEIKELISNKEALKSILNDEKGVKDITVQYKKAREDSEFYDNVRLVNLRLIQDEALVAKEFCKEMDTFFQQLLNNESAEKLCNEKLAQVLSKIYYLNIKYGKKLNLIEKGGLDQKLKRNGIQNSNEILTLNFKMGLTQDELDYLYFRKQIENYELFKKFIQVVRKSFSMESQDNKIIKEQLEDFICKNFQDPDFPIPGILGEGLINALKQDSQLNSGFLTDTQKQISEFVCQQARIWSDRLTKQETQLAEMYNQLAKSEDLMISSTIKTRLENRRNISPPPPEERPRVWRKKTKRADYIEKCLLDGYSSSEIDIE